MRASEAAALVVLALAVVVPPAAAPATAQPIDPAPASALEELGALAAGVWEAEDSRHEFTWTVGRLALRSRSYASGEEGWAPTSEGFWWWDEDAGLVRGTVVAVGMPFERMHYRSRVEGDRVVHDLQTFGELTGRFRETWTFSGEGYRWVLEQPEEDGFARVMGGAYRRVEGG